MTIADGEMMDVAIVPMSRETGEQIQLLDSNGGLHEEQALLVRTSLYAASQFRTTNRRSIEFLILKHTNSNMAVPSKLFPYGMAFLST